MATEKILKIRVRNEDTIALWKKCLAIYKSEDKNAEDLLRDALEYYYRWELSKKEVVIGF